MLPEKLSTDLTSLREGQERLAVVIEMTIDAKGQISASDVYRALVLNRAKLTYDGVAAWLDGNAPPPTSLSSVAGLDRQLRLQDQAAQALRRVRYERGALNFETVQAKPVFNDGVLTDMRADERNRAKELIEDFMIASNGVVARYLQSKGRSLLRRVLRSPERWPRIVALAASVGGRLPAQPDAHALNTFLASRRTADPATFPELSLSVLKLLGSGEYAVELPNQPAEGHFGLAVNEYTHSTAPNRRFPDLITQRLLKAALEWRTRRLHRRRTARARRSLHGARKERQQGRAPSPQGRDCTAADQSHRPAVQRRRDGRVRERHVGTNQRADRRRQSRQRLSRARRRRSRSRRARRTSIPSGASSTSRGRAEIHTLLDVHPRYGFLGRRGLPNQHVRVIAFEPWKQMIARTHSIYIPARSK